MTASPVLARGTRCILLTLRHEFTAEARIIGTLQHAQALTQTAWLHVLLRSESLNFER